MSEKKETTQEIDLIELFTNIGNWFQNKINTLFNLFLKTIDFLIKNVIWLALFVIIGIIIGFFIHKTTKKYFHTEMICISNTIPNSEVIRDINNWNYKTVFANKQYENIKSIKATYLLDKNNDGSWDVIDIFDNINTTDSNIINERVNKYLCIKIEVYDTSIISSIQQHLFSFMNNNRVLQLHNVQISQKKDLISAIQKEIKDLDSLRNIEYFKKQKTTSVKFNDMLLIGEQEPKLYHKEILELTQQLQKINKSLVVEKVPYEIISDFYSPIIEENSLIKLIINSIKVSLLIGLIVILLIKKRVKK